MSIGHDEYWSGQQRANVEAARDAGVNLAFFSGNEVFWKTRWESATARHRTLVCYKETHANANDRPDRRVDGHLARPARQPGAARAGERAHRPVSRSTRARRAIDGPGRYGTCGCGATRTSRAGAGQTATLAAEHARLRVGRRLDNGFPPRGLCDLSSTTRRAASSCCSDYGSTYGSAAPPPTT